MKLEAIGTGFLIGRLTGIASASKARWLVSGEAIKRKSWMYTGRKVAEWWSTLSYSNVIMPC